MLETVSIQHAKDVMKVGVNVKTKENRKQFVEPYSALRPGNIYAVPVARCTTTQKQFKAEHKSYYLKAKDYGPDDLNENGRKKETEPRTWKKRTSVHAHLCNKCGETSHSSMPQGVETYHGGCKGMCRCKPAKMFKRAPNRPVVHCLPCNT